MSKTGPIVDAGDSYYNYTLHTQSFLYRATDQVVVSLYPSSAARRNRLQTALVAATGPLAGYVIEKQLTETSVSLVRTARGPAPTLDVLQGRIAGFPNLKGLSPTFFYANTWTRTAIYDEIYIDLRNDVDASAFFAKGFSRVVKATGINAYNVTLRNGNALDVLRVAAKLVSSDLVQGAEPNHTLNIVPS